MMFFTTMKLQAELVLQVPTIGGIAVPLAATALDMEDRYRLLTGGGEIKEVEYIKLGTLTAVVQGAMCAFVTGSQSG